MNNMKEKIITDNTGEKITVKWDGERFTLVNYLKHADITRVILLNPKEAMKLADFVQGIYWYGGGDKC